MSDISFLVPGGALSGPLFASLLESDAGPALPAGTPIGPYRIERSIGRGGSGTVYRAERSDGAFAQSVALKVVKPDPRLREHLRRERAILAQLGHPGIARLFDGGETAGGEPWFAMELVKGRRVDEWCRRENASWRTRIRLVGEVCDSVQYAHARQLVHRDIKPSNILVDDDGFTRLLDFGISLALREPRRNDGTTAFTPEFASPEQLSGGEITTASDVYQLGRLLEVLLDPERDDRGLPDMPRLAKRNLGAIVRRATAREPEARYPSAADLKIDLQRALDNEPALGGHWDATSRLEFLFARHALAILVAGASLLALGSLAVHYTLEVTAQRDRAEESAQRAQVASEVLTSLFRGSSPAEEAPEQAAAAAVLDRGAERAVQRLEDEPEQRAIAAETLGNAYLDLGQGDKARPLLESTLAALDARAPRLPHERARLEILLARIAVADRRLDETAARLGRADALLRPLVATQQERADLDAVRILLADQRGDAASAQHQREALIARLEGTPVADSALFATLLNDRATTRGYANDYDAARADVQRAYAILRDRFGEMSPQALSMERRIVWFSLHGEHEAEAAQILSAQHDRVRESFGERSPEFAALLSYEGIVANRAGRKEEALDKFQRALVVARSVYGPDALLSAIAAHNVGDALIEMGRAEEALAIYREALRVRLLRLPANNQAVLVNRLQIARSECALGQYGTADADFASSRAALAARMVEGHPSLLVAAAFNVDCLLLQGRVDEAAAMFAREVPDQPRAKLVGHDAQRVDATARRLADAQRAKR